MMLRYGDRWKKLKLSVQPPVGPKNNFELWSVQLQQKLKISVQAQVCVELGAELALLQKLDHAHNKCKMAMVIIIVMM